MITEGSVGLYCDSSDQVLVMQNQENAKFVVTKDFNLTTKDVVQFSVSVLNTETNIVCGRLLN